MEKGQAIIHPKEVRRLVARLIAFLGKSDVQKSLKRYKQALKTAGPIFSEYYLKRRHPWFCGFVEYDELVNNFKCIHKHLTPDLELLAEGAKQAVDLLDSMPDPVKTKYKRDLLDFDNARNYLFEIQTAWHFYRKGYNLEWSEDDLNRRAEFLVVAPDFSFNVERKRVSVDIARKIHRKDFYQFADIILPEVRKRNQFGKLDVRLMDRLKSSKLNALCNEILRLIDTGFLKGSFAVQHFGNVELDLTSISNIYIDLDECRKKFYERMEEKAHGIIIADSQGGRPIDPIELTVMSEKADTVLDGIKEKISDARKQLNDSEPGFVACYLDGINGFSLKKLSSNGGLMRISKEKFKKNKYSHIAGINYSSEQMFEKGHGYKDTFHPGLLFRNNNCKFDKAKDFEFLNPPRF